MPRPPGVPLDLGRRDDDRAPGAGRAHEQLNARGINVWRSYVNEYCTSLEMAGFSLTLVKLDNEIKELLAAPAEIAVRVF